MIGFLKDRISSISSDLYEEVLKPSKIHKNRIIQIIPCKTTFRSVAYTANSFVWALYLYFKYVMHCAICCHLYNLKNVKNTIEERYF